MRRRIWVSWLAIVVAIASVVFWVVPFGTPQHRAGVILPFEDDSLIEIVASLRKELHATFGNQIRVDVMQAGREEGTLNALLERCGKGKYDLLLPIGTDLTQETLLRIGDKPIVGLDVGSELEAENFVGVLEVEVEQTLSLIRALFPDLEKMTLIHSPAERVYAQVVEFSALALDRGIEVQQLEVAAADDWMGLDLAIDADTELLLVLKDYPVTSQIKTLAALARQLQVPLVGSDERSVRQGGALAIGQQESSIGMAGAELAIEILSGLRLDELQPAQERETLLFANPLALIQQGIEPEALIATAEEAGYEILLYFSN